jgi:predicted metal-dependent phosphoesterase TrpH
MPAPVDILSEFTSIQDKPFGTRFFKADLHYHTPASTDARGSDKYGFNPYQRKYPEPVNNDPGYDHSAAIREFQYGILKDARIKAREIVWRFCQQGLSLVAVTDHNGIGTIWSDERGRMDLAAPTWYELIDEAARSIGTGLTILPGTEISTTGVHILAIFKPQEPRRKVHFMICDLLDEVGIGPDDWGKNPKLGHASVNDTLDLIFKKGGIAIPAHIDGSDQAVLELYEVNTPSMRQLLQNRNLRAVEVVDPNKLNAEVKSDTKTLTRKAWIDDARREARLPSVAYFQGSDAHDLRTIGKRFTYLKMTEPSFEGLQTAMKTPSSRVRIRDSKKDWDGLYIRGIAFDHPLLGKQTLRFNRNLNCISGKMGCGKTTLYSLMRAAVYPDYPQRDREGLLKKDPGGNPLTVMGYQMDGQENLKRDKKGNPIPNKGGVTLFVDLVKPRDPLPEEHASEEKLSSDLVFLVEKKLVAPGEAQPRLTSDEQLIQAIKELGEYKESESEHYAFHRDASQESMSIFCLEKEAETYKPSKLAEIKVGENGHDWDYDPSLYQGGDMKRFINPLQPKFYDASEMGEIIYDRSGKKLLEFLRKSFQVSAGEMDQAKRKANEKNIAKFNDLFLLPRFLDADKQTVLVRTREEKQSLEAEIDMIQEDLKRQDMQPAEKEWCEKQLGEKEAALVEKNKLIKKLAKDQFQLDEDFEKKQKDQLLRLSLSADNTLRLEMNLNWRQQEASKPAMVDFLQLSRSQRKIAMMCMVIVNGHLPVIIDAPEEEFDNGDIARYLLPLILGYKDARQILLFTNHPLLAVNTDPDNYLLILQDAKKDKFVDGFAIDVPKDDSEDTGKKAKKQVDRKELLLDILEGNLEAFRRRGSLYE